MSNMREASKANWTSSNTVEHINTGSLQRIADAIEVMAHNYQSLLVDRDRYKRWYEETSAKLDTERRSNAALRGYIKRMKARP